MRPPFPYYLDRYTTWLRDVRIYLLVFADDSFFSTPTYWTPNILIVLAIQIFNSITLLQIYILNYIWTHQFWSSKFWILISIILIEIFRAVTIFEHINMCAWCRNFLLLWIIMSVVGLMHGPAEQAPWEGRVPIIYPSWLRLRLRRLFSDEN